MRDETRELLSSRLWKALYYAACLGFYFEDDRLLMKISSIWVECPMCPLERPLVSLRECMMLEMQGSIQRPWEQSRWGDKHLSQSTSVIRLKRKGQAQAQLGDRSAEANEVRRVRERERRDDSQIMVWALFGYLSHQLILEIWDNEEKHSIWKERGGFILGNIAFEVSLEEPGGSATPYTNQKLRGESMVGISIWVLLAYSQ